MKRHFDPEKRLVQEFHPGQPQLPIEKLIVQYIRQSSREQVKKNKQSAILLDRLFGLALWKPSETSSALCLPCPVASV